MARQESVEGEVVSDTDVLQLWMAQTDKYWTITFSTHAVAGLIVSGWYLLDRDKNQIQADLVLGLGILMMVCQYLIVRRMTEHAGAYYDHIKGRLPSVVQPFMGLSAYRVVQAIPIIIACFFVVILVT